MPRIDRFLSIHFFYPLLRLRRQDPEPFISILMYHSISDELELGPAYYRLNTSPKRFFEQMQFLKEHGYKVISLSDALNLHSILPTLPNPMNPSNSINPSNPSNPQTRYASRGTRIEERGSRTDDPASSIQYHEFRVQSNPSNPINPSNQSNPSNPSNSYVVITFDDGYQDFMTFALPILMDLGYSATIYLPTGFIGNNGRTEFKGKPCLTWSEVRLLSESGIELGSHTVTHSKLWELSWSQVEEELRASKQTIEDETGRPVRHFSFPFAYPADRKWEAFFQKKLKGCGYISCATTKVGRYRISSSPLSLNRLPVNDTDDLRLFEAKLLGGYDWVSKMQSIYKPLKSYLTAESLKNLRK